MAPPTDLNGVTMTIPAKEWSSTYAKSICKAFGESMKRMTMKRLTMRTSGVVMMRWGRGILRMGMTAPYQIALVPQNQAVG